MEKPLMDAVAPRSTWSHWGSLQAEDQRVVMSPSIALEAAYEALSTEDAVASAPMAMLVSVAAFAGVEAPSAISPARRPRIAAMAVVRRLRARASGAIKSL